MQCLLFYDEALASQTLLHRFPSWGADQEKSKRRTDSVKTQIHDI